MTMRYRMPWSAGMRAIVLDRDRAVVRTDHPEPTLRDGEVLVQVLCAGICETDLQLIRGYMGFRGVLGHEFVGVAQTGPLAGRRVVADQLQLPAVRHVPRRPPVALPPPFRPRHSQPRRRVCGCRWGAVAEL